MRERLLKWPGRKPRQILREASAAKQVAVDIGLYSVKCCHVDNEVLSLQEFPLFEQPKDLRDLDRKELTERQMSSLGRAVNEIAPNAEVILSPQPSKRLVARILRRPADTDLKDFLAKELPFDPENFTFDIEEVDTQATEKKSKKSDAQSSTILAVATDLDFIRRSIGLLGEFQLQVNRITPSLVGLVNYLLLTGVDGSNQPLVVLDLGATFSQVVVFKGKHRLLARTIEVGGNHLNLELARKLNVDMETAERIKLERTLIDDSVLGQDQSSLSSPTFRNITGTLYRLLDELKESLTFFEDFFLTDISLSRVFLAGGTANLTNLDLFLGKELGLPVERACSAVYELAPEHQFAPQFAPCVGLLPKPSTPGMLDINLMNNIEGMLFKLHDNDYYLTREGFIDKKRYKKKHRRKPAEPARPAKQVTLVDEPSPSIVALIKDLQEKVRALLRGEKVDLRLTSFGKVDKTPLKERLKKIFVVFGAFVLALAAAYQFYWAPRVKRLDSTMNAYLKTRLELDKHAQTLAPAASELVYKVTKTDKILWTNKLRTISAVLPENIWISDLDLKETTEKFEGMEVAKRMLALTCHVDSKRGDHLQTIALFVRSLKDQKEFVQDFTDVHFHAAQRSAVDTDIIDFTLTLPLRRNLLEETTETVVKPEGEEEGDTFEKMIRRFKKVQDQRFEVIDR
jgi:Tfp pilus assembly PilM family ATPase